MATAQATILLQHIRRLAGSAGQDVRLDGELLRSFSRDGDEAAFAMLVRRHGPMGWGVGRGMRAEAADAEDVLQGVFMLLAGRAGSLRGGASVGGWLHGVAYRLALKAREAATRRRAWEGRAPVRTPSDPLAE